MIRFDLTIQSYTKARKASHIIFIFVQIINNLTNNIIITKKLQVTALYQNKLYLCQNNVVQSKSKQKSESVQTGKEIFYMLEDF